MTTEYGNFPGIKVSTAGGSITNVAVGDDEIVVLFGEASYQDDDTLTSDGDEDPLESSLTGDLETPEQINARRVADSTFGEGSELADAMREALANGANIDFLYGVAPRRYNVVDEVKSSQTSTGSTPLSNAPIWEDTKQDVQNPDDPLEDTHLRGIDVTDDGSGSVDNVEFAYDGEPSTPSSSETVVINPLTGEFAADASPDGDYLFSYKYLDWSSAITASSVENVVEEGDTAVWKFVGESDDVASSLDSTIDPLRKKQYKMVLGLSGAEPNDNEVITTDGQSLASDHSNYQRRDARYDTANYSNANNSVDSDYFFKVAPARLEDSKDTILGGVAGLFGGNSISNPIYNDELEGYDSLEQSLSLTEADELRGENVIPVRQAGSIRVKDNLSTSTDSDWERDFWRRRIVDRVILIAKSVGDSTVGKINDERTRNAASRMIATEIRELINQRLLRPNTASDENWFVDVYEDSNNTDQVNIDIGVTPYGIVKRIKTSITINT